MNQEKMLWGLQNGQRRPARRQFHSKICIFSVFVVNILKAAYGSISNYQLFPLYGTKLGASELSPKFIHGDSTFKSHAKLKRTSGHILKAEQLGCDLYK